MAPVGDLQVFCVNVRARGYAEPDIARANRNEPFPISVTDRQLTRRDGYHGLERTRADCLDEGARPDREEDLEWLRCLVGVDVI